MLLLIFVSWSATWNEIHHATIADSSFKNQTRLQAIKRNSEGLLLYFYNHTGRHMSHQFSADSANNFISIYGNFGNLSKSIWALPSGVVVKVQYTTWQNWNYSQLSEQWTAGRLIVSDDR